MSAAAELRALRHRLGLTQAELAAALDVSKRYVEGLEQGQRLVSRRTLLAARHLVLLDWLGAGGIAVPDEVAALVCDTPPADDPDY